MMNAHYWIDKLQLTPHQEGGYFKQTYASTEKVTLPNGNTRHLSTSILFLLTAQNPSHFHRLQSDEIWYYHAGHSLTVHMIFPDGSYHTQTLGLSDTDVLQFTVPKGVIFGSSVNSPNADDFSVVSCSVTPGFEYEDFELLTQQQLLTLYPQHKDIIMQLAY